MDYRFYLNEVEIDEPVGWSDFELSMKRDDTYHGMQFIASTGALRFWGIAASFLSDQKEQFGISADVTFKAEAACDTGYEEVIEGRLNFGKYKDTCGSLCIVEIPFEEQSCTVTLNNRFDQKVDLDSLISADTVTVLPVYAQLGQLISMPPKALQTAVDGSVADAGDATQIGLSSGIPLGQLIYIRPEYSTERYNNIKTGQLTGGTNCQNFSGLNVSTCFSDPITPQLLFEDIITCFDGNFFYSSRMKGSFTWNSDVNIIEVKHIVYKWDGVGALDTDGEVIQEATLYDSPFPGTPGDEAFTFDNTLDGNVTIEEGIGFYAIMSIIAQVEGVDGTIDVVYDKETWFLAEATKLCPPSFAQYYMVHEALSRIVENVTNGCIRVKSAYYGRIESQPFAFDADGCGGLRMVTSGLKLRGAPDGKIFSSAKDLISGLNAIDNIGFSIIDDPARAGKRILLIEPVEFFYKDAQMVFLDAVAEVSNEVQENLHYAKINVGYKKWEVEDVNGLNEFNSTREMRTNVETVNTTLDITSNLVAGSYPIELTRLQRFAESGAADSTYDNEIFIIALERAAYSFIVEEDKILNPQNIFDPATVKNFRLSPMRNLMRWFKSIVNTYTNISSSDSRIFFNAGTGNFLAAGLLDDDTDCRLENATLFENGSIGVTNFRDIADATPLFKNEYSSFEYPLKLSQWNTIKSDPYGYIAYTCGGDSVVKKGFIKELKYRPAQGMANFTLRKKWGS